MNNKRVIIGILASFVFIYLIIWIPRPGGLLRGELTAFQAFFGQTRVDFGNLWRILLHLKPFPLILSILIVPVHCLVRSHRWSIMVKRIGRLKLFDGFSIIIVSYFANSVLPLRIGEVARGVLLGRRINISNSAGLGTVALDRVLDLISLLILITITGLLYDFPVEVKHAAWILSIVSLGIILIIVAFVIFKEQRNGLLGKLLERLPTGLGKKLIGMIDQFVVGLTALKSSSSYLLISIDSVIIWSLYAAQVWLVMIAFSFPQNYSLIASEPILTSFVILVIASVVLSVPSAPAGLGTFHAAIIFALALFGVDVDEAVGFALIIHAVTVLFYILGGFPLMWREGLKLGNLRGLKVNSE